MSTELQQPEMSLRHPARLELVGSGGESCVLEDEGHCITCSDESTPARVVQIDLEQSTALVEMMNQTTEIDITLVDEVAPGGWLLVHGGVAIATLEERHASAEVNDEQR